jgi:signal transduction histidine kinase
VIRLVVVAAAAVGLILFVAFVVSRLLRTRTRGMSIRMQVFLALGGIVGTFAFGLGVMVIDRIEARAVRLATQAAFDEAASMSGMLQGELDRSGLNIEEVAARFEHERRRGAPLRLELIDRAGRQLFPRGEASGKGAPGNVTVDAPIVVRGEVVGAVRVVRPTIVMLSLLEDFAPTVLVISLVLGAASALAAAWIGRAIARPIEALSAFAERVSSGERTAAAPIVAGGREVARLTRSIDSMRRQLEGRPFVETFAADLSHELKNPVAAVRASAEILEDGALDEPQEARRFVARIREAADRIERLLGELLSLARIEARGVESFTMTEMGQLARAALDGVREGSDRVTLRLDGDLRVRGDASWLSRALANLIENGLAHSPPDAPVLVQLRREELAVVVEVDSSGTVSKHVRERLFRRFVTTRQAKGGSGLGLAIVRAIVEAHGGSVELANAGPPTVTFRMRLPPGRLRATEQLRDVVARPEEPRQHDLLPR